MKSMLLILAFLSFAHAALAETSSTPAPVCTTLRNANAFILVTRHSWNQSGGAWTQTTEVLANTQAQVPVYQESSAGCDVPVAYELDGVTIDGVKQDIRVYGFVSIQLASLHSNPNKNFTASYWSSTEPDHSSWSTASTADLSAAKMTVSFNEQHSTSATIPHEDALTVGVFFADGTK